MVLLLALRNMHTFVFFRFDMPLVTLHDYIYFQGSAKHFIPHNAITCSIVSGDVVACVLLLYNPATKCPLHVHAYRCDSDLTAHALHDQLQILIKKPENQKRFAELELK